MSDTEDTDTNEDSTPEDKLDQMQMINMELTRKLDKLHAKEFQNAIIQPCLFVFAMLFMILSFYYFHAGLLILVPFCFVLSCVFPMLQVPLWISLALILVRLVS